MNTHIKTVNNKILFNIYKLIDLTYNDKIKWTFLGHIKEGPYNLYHIEPPIDMYVSKINDVYELSLHFNFDTCHLTIYTGLEWISIKSVNIDMLKALYLNYAIL